MESLCYGMEDLTLRWKSLSLTEVEELKVDLMRDKKKMGVVLAAKFFTCRNVNIEAVAKTFHPIWRTRGILRCVMEKITWYW